MRMLELRRPEVSPRHIIKVLAAILFDIVTAQRIVFGIGQDNLARIAIIHCIGFLYLR